MKRLPLWVYRVLPLRLVRWIYREETERARVANERIHWDDDPAALGEEQPR